jgi:aldehyde:ferredoxin oxidoreductase
MGVITADDTDGVALEFGNAEALTVMAEKTGKYEGFGQTLGLGSRLLCEKYGHPELSMAVKGQEFAGYDSRALQGMGLGFATSNRGACHLKHDTFAQDMDLGFATSNRGACHLKHDTFAQDMEDQTGQGKAKPCKDSQDLVSMVDSSGLCLFVMAAWGIEEFQKQIDAACEGDWTVERLTATGERIWNLERLFNLAAGLSAADDNLPKRLPAPPRARSTSSARCCPSTTWSAAGRPRACPATRPWPGSSSKARTVPGQGAQKPWTTSFSVLARPA